MASIIKGKNPRKPYTVRYQHDGKQREKSFTTKRQAEDFRVKFEHDSRLQVFVDPRNGSTPFTEYAQRWADSLDRSPATRRQYASALNAHIVPALAGRTLASVAADRDAADALLTAMREAGASAVTRARTARVMVAVADAAVTAGKIPSHRLGGLAVRRDATAKPATITPLTRAQLAALADAMPPALALSVWLMAGTGLRVAEALAVRADGFREDGATLRITEQIAPHGGYAPLKARRAGQFRDMPVPSWLRSKVAEHIAAHGTEGYLFPGAAYRTYIATFKRAAKLATLPADLTPHALRHRYASVLLAAGIPVTDVSRWLGHRSLDVTYAIYSHFIPSSWDRARGALESL